MSLPDNLHLPEIFCINYQTMKNKERAHIPQPPDWLDNSMAQ